MFGPKPVEININIGQEDKPYLPCPVQEEELLGFALPPQVEREFVIEQDPCKELFGFAMPDFLQDIFDAIAKEQDECEECDEHEDRDMPQHTQSLTSIIDRGDNKYQKQDLSSDKFRKPLDKLKEKDRDNDKYSKYWFK